MRAFALALTLSFTSVSAANAQPMFGASRLQEAHVIFASYLFLDQCPGWKSNLQAVLSALEVRGFSFTKLSEDREQMGEILRLKAVFAADPTTYCKEITTKFGPFGAFAAGIATSK